MAQKYVLSALIILLASEMTLARAEDSLRRISFLSVFSLNSCSSPDLADSMSAEDLQKNLQSIVHSLIGLEHLTASDLLNVIVQNGYREKACSGFLSVEPALTNYVRSREKCLGNNKVNGVQVFVGFHRTLCENNFEETLTDVLETVGDDCIDSLFQVVLGKVKLNQEFIQICSNTTDQFHGPGEDEFSRIKEKHLPAFMKNCVLNLISNTCGATAGIQFKRLSDRYLNVVGF